MPLITSTIKAPCDFATLATFKKWAVLQLNTLIESAAIGCCKCDRGETCFEHGYIKLCWRTGSYTIKNNKDPLTEIRDKVRAMRTALAQNIKRSTVGHASTKELDNALKAGTVTFTKEKTMRLTKSADPKAKASKKKVAAKKAASKKTKGASVGMRVKVGSKIFDSATLAFRDLKINKGLGTLRRLRKTLHASGECTIEGHKFKLAQ